MGSDQAGQRPWGRYQQHPDTSWDAEGWGATSGMGGHWKSGRQGALLLGGCSWGDGRGAAGVASRLEAPNPLTAGAVVGARVMFLSCSCKLWPWWGQRREVAESWCDLAQSFCRGSWFHSVIARLGLEGTLENHPVQPLCHSQGHLPLDQTAQVSGPSLCSSGSEFMGRGSSSQVLPETGG